MRGARPTGQALPAYSPPTQNMDCTVPQRPQGWEGGDWPGMGTEQSPRRTAPELHVGGSSRHTLSLNKAWVVSWFFHFLNVGLDPKYPNIKAKLLFKDSVN